VLGDSVAGVIACFFGERQRAMPEFNLGDTPWWAGVIVIVLIQFRQQISEWFKSIANARAANEADSREHKQSAEAKRLESELQREDLKTQHQLQQSYAREERFSDLLRDQLDFIKDEVSRKLQDHNKHIAQSNAILQQTQTDIAEIRKDLSTIRGMATKNENHLQALTTALRRRHEDS
jgi:DNA anti-recombination protein RmuC